MRIRCDISWPTNLNSSRWPTHDDVIKWKYFRVTGPLWPGNSPYKDKWHGAWMLSLICAWINGWVNNGEAGDLRRHRAHYDVMVMWYVCIVNGTPLYCIWEKKEMVLQWCGRFFLCNSNAWWISYYCNSISGHHTAMHLCTCQLYLGIKFSESSYYFW